jgi:hypothetical protein
VSFHALFCLIRVASAECLQDLAMLADGLIEPPILVDLLVPIESDFFPQLGYDLVQNAVSGQLLEQGVKNIVDRNDAVAGRGSGR